MFFISLKEISRTIIAFRKINKQGNNFQRFANVTSMHKCETSDMINPDV